MSVQEIGITLNVRPQASARSEIEVLSALLDQWFPGFFALRSARGRIAGQRIAIDVPSNETSVSRLWPDEALQGSSPLTVLGRPLDPFATDALRAMIQDSHEVTLRLVGGLYHQPPATGMALGWYGRRVIQQGSDAALQELAAVSIRWSAGWRSIRTVLSSGGYPLTSVAPGRRAKDALQRAELASCVEANRRRLEAKWRELPELCGAEQYFWEVDTNAAFFEEDRTYLGALAAKLSAPREPQP
jgi:hypothetical protein